jgi:hypothetical protein
MKVKKETLLIFFSSLVLSFLTLLFERLVGINWDYHPDSVYYIENFTDFINQQLHHNRIIFSFNQFYFFIVNFLGGKVSYIIFFNIILYSYTNVFVYKILKNKLNLNYLHLGTFILLLNPYRLHLSTTILKDTLVIFLFVLIFYRILFVNIVSIFFLILTRSAAFIYYFVFFRYFSFFSKNFKLKIFFLIIFILFLFNFIYSDFVLNYLIKLLDHIEVMHNEVPHKVRSFDNVENFSSLGNWGILIKAILWPILLLTGTLIFFSPSVEFFFISLSSLISLIYCIIYLKSSSFELFSFLVLAIIATLTSGYPVFIRYSYPIITIIPILIAINKSNKS